MNAPYQQPQPYPGYGGPYAPPPPPTPQQRLAMLSGRIRQLRSDLTSAFNPYSLQKILDQTLELFDYLISGSAVHPNPNQVPGKPLDALDQGHTRVEFFGAPQAPPPGQPVQNGDVQFTRHAPGAGGAVGGQTVEFYAGPPGPPPGFPPGLPPNIDSNGQQVQYYAAPPGGLAQPTQQVPVAAPSTATINNPPSSQLIPGRPAVTVEAGYVIPPNPNYAPPPQGLPHAPAFSEQMTPQGRPLPQTRDELLSMLPIPLA